MCWLSIVVFLCVPFPVLVFFLLYSVVFPVHNVSDTHLPHPIVSFTLHGVVFAISNIHFHECLLYLAALPVLCV